MKEAAKRRVGRPTKQPSGKRVSLGLKVTAEVKQQIEEAARASGRTQSQEAEHLIERALLVERLMQSMRTTVEQVERGNFEAALYRRGFTQIRDARGTLWAPPGYPGIERSGFIVPEDDR